MDNHRSEHRNLAALIKGLHKHLRRKFRESNGDHEAVWEDHAHDDDRLKLYANAMKQLATDHWSEYPESRIDWCYQVIMEYFMDGGLQKALEKDAKHRFFESQRLREAHGKELCSENQVVQDGLGNCPGLSDARLSASGGLMSVSGATTRKTISQSHKTKDRASGALNLEQQHCVVECQSSVDPPLQPDTNQLEVTFEAHSTQRSSGAQSIHQPSESQTIQKPSLHQPSKPQPVQNPREAPQSIIGQPSNAQSAHQPRRVPSNGSTPDPQETPQDASHDHHPSHLRPSGNDVIADDSSHAKKDDGDCARPLRLLDVGSCYNPFRTYPHIRPVAVDLCPADTGVLQCDFLHLDIIPPATASGGQQNNDHEDNSKGPDYLDQLCSPVQHLTACSFDIVVFCLLLEYMPSPLQRARCCVKAVRLLSLNGLLVIITPDSKSSHRNAPMMKSWRSALAMLGMTRWKYQKKQHLHCMAFRKVSEIAFDDVVSMEKEISPLLYIPQDFTDACYDDVETIVTDKERQESFKTSEENEVFRFSVFEELPVFCGDVD